MLSAIIPTLTNEQGLFKLVSQLKKIKDIEIIIVDNKPNENKKKLKKFIYLPQTKNLGFAKGVNIGAKKAKGKWLLILNDDIEQITQKLIKKMLNFAQKNHLDAVSPVLVKPTGEVENYGYNVLPIGKIQLLTHPITNNQSLITNNDLDGLTAACLFIKKDVFKKVSGFDESFFAYLEDVDLFLRLKKQGFRFGIDPKTFVIHNHMTTSSKMGYFKEKQDFVNWIRIILKNWGVKKIIRYFPGIIIERGRNLSGLIKKMLKVYLSQ